jgi:hypothetical protein
MTTLYAITPLANNNVQVAKYSHEIDPEPIVKTDVTPTSSVQTPANPINKNVANKNITNTHSIDNNPKNDYNTDIESPETKPISKIDVDDKQNTSVKQPEEPTNIEPVSNDNNLTFDYFSAEYYDESEEKYVLDTTNSNIALGGTITLADPVTYTHRLYKIKPKFSSKSGEVLIEYVITNPADKDKVISSREVFATKNTNVYGNTQIIDSFCEFTSNSCNIPCSH